MHSAVTEFFTTSRVARQLEISEATVRRLALRGELPFVRLSSGERAFRPAAVEQLQRRREAAGRGR